MSASAFRTLTVDSVTLLTPDAIALTLAVPPELQDAFRFVPGQYLTLEASIEGSPVRRSYSICSVPGEPLQVGIKKVPGGRFSTFAHEQLRPGHTIDVMPPAGRFVVQDRDPKGAHHVGFAAGSGITPILSILRFVLETRPKDRFTLFYGNRSLASVMFLETLHQAKDRYLDRLALHHFISRESMDVPLLRGRLDQDKVETLAEVGALRPSEVDAAYVCGPGDMIDAVTDGLSAVGVPPERVRSERFTSASSAPPTSKAAPSISASNGVVDIEVRLDGVTRTFPLSSGGSVIQAAAAAGIDIPWSCSGGMCSTCRCKLVDGEATMTVNYALEPWELERGYILACQAQPQSDRLVLDFDDQ